MDKCKLLCSLSASTGYVSLAKNASLTVQWINVKFCSFPFTSAFQRKSFIDKQIQDTKTNL